MARREKPGKGTEETGDTNAWMVTFSDLLTLMITFFVLLLSMSSMDEKKLKNMFGLFTETLGVLELGKGRDVQKLEMAPDIGIIYENFIIEENLIKQLLDQAIAGEKGSDVERLRGSIAFGDMITVDERGVVITLSDAILFKPGETEVSREAYPLIDKLSDHLKNNSYGIKIEGHTDSTPAGADTSNLVISAKRANSVMRYLSEVSGIGMDRLSARGYGEHYPLADNDTDENRAKNRRVEIIISKDT